MRLPTSQKTLPAGTDFKLVVWRCPLSGGVGDRPGFLHLPPELLRETWPYGAMVLDQHDNPVGRDMPDRFNETHHVEGVIPWRWITEYYDRREASPGWKRVPSFDWTVGS